jgi:hypothetical protein
LGLVFGSDEDLITIDIPVPKLEPFIFAIANTDYKEKYEDIVLFIFELKLEKFHRSHHE